MSHDQLTPSAPASQASVSGQSHDQNEIPVKCGPIEGSLHLDKLGGGQSGREGNIKCIYCSSESKWVTPIEFESLGGKSKSEKWKQSIKTNNNVSIGVHLSALGSDVSRSYSHSHAAVPPSLSLTSNVSVGDASLIVSPLLAFVKAHRLRGSTTNLKQSVATHFDLSSLTDAQKLLWDHCGDTLRHLGLTYHTRRSTDKRDAFEATLADILSAFNKLDEDDKLPFLYCEALHLLNLPCLEPDPISKRLDTNNQAISCLVQKVDSLSAPFNSTQLALEQLVSSLKDQLTTFSSSVSSFSKSLSKQVLDPLVVPQTMTNPALSSSGKGTSTHYSSTPVDRSANVILFGVPELSLSDTKSVIDEVTTHMIGRSVRIRDAFRIGRKKPNSDESSRPRPLLIKLDSCWDRRILLSSRRSLKFFEKYKLFIREDLPPQARKTRSNPSLFQDGSQTNVISTVSNVDQDQPQ